MDAAAAHLRSALPNVPRIGVVLGSGLSELADRLTDTVAVPFETVPGLPPTGVAGHAGHFLHGRLGGCEVLLQAGRFHVYEGHPMEVVVAPVRILASLGVDTLVLTAASGGLRADLDRGTLVLVDDHINMMSRSPLTGPTVVGEARFPGMSEPYDRGLQELALTAARELGLELVSGVYAGVLGPSYETAAEVRMLAKLGADIVGMSTVPEVITARARGLRCLAISVVTNPGTGLAAAPLSHAEVLEVGHAAAGRLSDLVVALVPRAARQSTETK